MKRGTSSLRRLRWKLTLSYTLVTVVTLLVVELALFLALAAFVHSSQLLSTVADDVGNNLAPRLEPKLAGSSPDLEGMREEIRSYDESLAPQGGDQEPGSGNFQFGYGDPESTRFFVVDAEGTLLVRHPERVEPPEGFPEGERFDAGRLAGLTPLLDAALDGKKDAGRLSGEAEGRMLLVTPLQDDEGRVAGALVSTTRMPGFGRLAGGLLPVLGVSVAALAVPAAVVGTFFGFATAWWLTRRLKKLTRASEAWSRGDFSTLAEDRSKDELGQLSRELDGMAGQIEGLLRTQGELAASEARNGFARDLHDSVKQQVYATALHVDTARTLMQRDPKAADDRLVRAKELLVESQKELNVLIRGMRPAVLEDEGLAGALRDHAAMWSRGSGIPVEVRVEGERETTPEVEHTLFRVAQEALANVARHSGADHAEVSLTYDRDAVALRVADDGRGFEPSRNTGEGFDPAQANGGGFGLGSMHKRVSALGGRCDVDSVPGGGTRVVCVCPLDGAGVEGENA